MPLSTVSGGGAVDRTRGSWSVRYPVILLDVGETLLGPREPFGATYSRVLRALGVDLDPATLDVAIRETVVEIGGSLPQGADRYGHFPDGETGYWLRVVAGVLARASRGTQGGSLARRALEPLRDAFREPAAWEVFPDVVPTLDALRARGVRLATVSNWDSRLRGLLARLDLLRHFDELGVSHEEGVEKPDPRLFHAVLGRLGAAPAEALHVGDVPELDLAGALRAGVDCVLVDRRRRLDPRYSALGDLWTLPTIAERGVRKPGA